MATTTTSPAPPVDTVGNAMELVEYRPGPHNSFGYTKGWCCDACAFFTPDEPSAESDRVKKRWHSATLHQDLCIDCAAKAVATGTSPWAKLADSTAADAAAGETEGTPAKRKADDNAEPDAPDGGTRKRLKADGDAEETSRPKKKTAYMLFRIDNESSSEGDLSPQAIAKMWLTLGEADQEPYLMAAQEMGGQGDDDKTVATTGAYSTGAGKYRKGRGKARIWSDEEVAIYIKGLRMHGRNMEAIHEMLKPTKTEQQIKGWFNNYRYKMGLDAYIEEYYATSGAVNPGEDPDERALRSLPGDVGDVEIGEDGERKPLDGAERSQYCSFCCALELPSKLLSCQNCGNSGHQKCLKYNARLWSNCKQNKGWECIECKACVTCRVSSFADKLLFCDWCDQAQHMFCLKPPLKEAPTEAWKCPTCQEQEDVELAKTFVGLSPEQEEEIRKKAELEEETKKKAAAAAAKAAESRAAEEEAEGIVTVDGI